MAKKKKLPKAQYGQSMSSPGSDNFKNTKGFNSAPIFGQLAQQFRLDQMAKKGAADAMNTMYAANEQRRQEEEMKAAENRKKMKDALSPSPAPISKKKGGSVKSKKKK
jgi:hypothetical protein